MSQAYRTRVAAAVVAAALCGLASTHAAADPYEDALTRFRSADYKGAIVTLKSALQAEPSPSRAHCRQSPATSRRWC